VPENNHQHSFLITHFSMNFAPPKNDAPTVPSQPAEKLLTPDHDSRSPKEAQTKFEALAISSEQKKKKWWRRGELNPRPRNLATRSLHAYPVPLVSLLALRTGKTR
jgi:hypothetical protein